MSSTHTANTTAAGFAIRRSDIVASEVTKIATSASTLIMLVVALTANLVLAAVEASGLAFYTGGTDVPKSLGDFGIVMIAPLYAFLVVPVFAAASEYQGGQLRMTLTATPRRLALALAKLVAVLAAGAVGALIVLTPARFVIGVADGMSLGTILLDLGRWMGMYVLMSLIAFGLAGVLRSAITSLGILIALPIAIGTGILQWPDGIRFLPDQAALSLIGTPGYEVTGLPPEIAAGVLVAWALVMCAASAFSLVRRDA